MGLVFDGEVRDETRKIDINDKGLSVTVRMEMSNEEVGKFIILAREFQHLLGFNPTGKEVTPKDFDTFSSELSSLLTELIVDWEGVHREDTAANGAVTKKKAPINSEHVKMMFYGDENNRGAFKRCTALMNGMIVARNDMNAKAGGKEKEKK